MSTFPYTRAYFHRADSSNIGACFVIKHPPEELYEKPFAVINGAVWVVDFSEARGGFNHADSPWTAAWLYPTHGAAKAALFSDTSYKSARPLVIPEYATKHEYFLYEPTRLLQEPTMNAQNTRQFLTLANAVAIVVVKFNQDDRYNRTEAELKKYEYLTDIDGLAVGDYVTVRGQQGEIKVVKVVEVKNLDKQAYTGATPLKWVIDHVDMSGELAREELFIQFQRLEKALEAGRQKLESKKLFDLVKNEMSTEDRQLAAKLLGVRK